MIINIKYIGFVVVLFLSLTALCQVDGNIKQGNIHNDTIEVTNSASTYLIFEEEVEFIDLGELDSYVAKIEGNTVFIRSTGCDVQPTTFIIKHGSSFLYGRLEAKVKPLKSLYDYRGYFQNKPKTEKSEEQKTLDLAKELKSINDKFDILKNKDEEYKTIAVIENQITLMLTNMFHDQKYSYFKIKVVNNSSVNFIVDSVFVNSINNQKLITNEYKMIHWVTPKDINSKSLEYIYFAVPIISITSTDKLRIILKDKGSKKINLFIPSKIINNAEIY